jgi:uncharacterized protein (TIGR02300 family)
MPNPEWGTKRVCPSCGARFYDLQNDPTTCPVCNSSFSLDSLTLKRTRPERVEAKPAPKTESEPELAEEVLEGESDIEVADDILEDDDEDSSVPLEDIAERPSEDSET